MSQAEEGPGQVPHKLGPAARFLLWPLGLLYRLWAASIRIESVDLSDVGKESASERPCVLMLWHNRLFIAGEWHRRFRKDMTCYGLISASKTVPCWKPFTDGREFARFVVRATGEAPRRFGNWFASCVKVMTSALRRTGREGLATKRNRELFGSPFGQGADSLPVV